jgi:DNA-binding IclR family transcriptional regulator
MITIADAIDADALRIRHEFLDMPGLVLTVAQTAKLYALSASHAQALLDSLVAEGFLSGEPGGRYRRSTLPISA